MADAVAVAGVAAGSMLVPAVAAVPLGLWLAGRHQAGHTAGFVLFIVAAVAVTAFPVLARIVADTGLARSRVGVIALAAAAVDDVVAWVLLAVALAVSTASADTAWQLVLLPLYALVMGLVVRPLMRRLLGMTGVGTLGLALVLGFALLSGAATEWMGLHFIFGTFAAGLCLPRDRGTGSDGREIDVRESLLARITPLATTLLLPTYFVVAGLSVDVRGLDTSNLVELILILLVAIGGKLIGTFAGARLTGIDGHEASMLASLMNTRGLTELVVLTAGLQAGILDQALYTLLVLTALVTTAMTGPLLWLIGRRRSRATRAAASSHLEQPRTLGTVPPVTKRTVPGCANRVGQRKSREVTRILSPSGSKWSASRLVTPSGERSSMPRTIRADESRATRRCRIQTPWEQTTLIRPCSSSRFMKVIPDAVDGRCRWVTTPATSTRRPTSAVRSADDGSTPRASSPGRRCANGWSSVEMLVAHRSSARVSNADGSGNSGGCTSGSVPGRKPG